MKTGLDLLAPVIRNYAAGRLYALAVRGAKYILGLGSVAMIALVFLWPDMQATQAVAPHVAGIDTAVNRLDHPQFDAVDKEGQPFTLRAQTALSAKADPDQIDLVNPNGVMLQKNGIALGLVGDTGTYAQEKKILHLQGNARVIEDKGLTLSTPDLTLDVQAKTIESNGAVNVQGPMGTLEARGLTGDHGAGILIFKGPAKLTLPEGSLKK